MFNQNLIVAIKAGNKVLREVKDTAFLPFGCEYQILIKNMDSRRVQVKVWIDGTDATEGTALVLNGNSEVEFERFIKNGNLKEGNKFKFIERTENIEKHRGSKVDDGFIRVEYQFEKLQPVINTWNGYYSTPTIGGTGHWLGGSICTNNVETYGATPKSVMRGFDATASVATAALNSVTMNATTQSAETTFNDAGITVPGAKSEQQFTQAAWFQVETTKHVINLKLLGESPEGKKVEAPVTVKAKPVCSTCGRVNKATSKFCSECGTSLTLF